ncbi:hypothetical protein OA58_12950 [Microcystis aeruginosa NIES-88]|nr:hypothetical protein OA58_12950 [Microcystis aeruginosa NIES-88]
MFWDDVKIAVVTAINIKITKFSPFILFFLLLKLKWMKSRRGKIPIIGIIIHTIKPRNSNTYFKELLW